MTEYKVMTEKDSMFRGAFDAQAIEASLNQHASEGWRLVSAVSITNQKTSGSQMMMILERPRP
jgi:hypothetical protein